MNNQTTIIAVGGVLIIAGAGIYFMSKSYQESFEDLQRDHTAWMENAQQQEDVVMNDADDKVEELKRAVGHLHNQFQDSHRPPPPIGEIIRTKNAVDRAMASLRENQNMLIDQEIQKVREQSQYELSVKELEFNQRLAQLQQNVSEQAVSRTEFDQQRQQLMQELDKARKVRAVKVEQAIPKNIVGEFIDRDVFWYKQFENNKAQVQRLEAQLLDMQQQANRQQAAAAFQQPTPGGVDDPEPSYFHGTNPDLVSTEDRTPDTSFAGPVGENSGPPSLPSSVNSMALVSHEPSEMDLPPITEVNEVGENRTDLLALPAPVVDNKPDFGLKMPQVTVEVTTSPENRDAFNKKPFVPSMGGVR